jgi:hypothetical protein
MSIIERNWRILLAAAFLTTVCAATAPASDLPNTAAARPTPTAVVTPAKPVAKTTKLATPAPKSVHPQPKPIRLASRVIEPARECYGWPYCGGHYFLMLGIAF